VVQLRQRKETRDVWAGWADARLAGKWIRPEKMKKKKKKKRAGLQKGNRPNWLGLPEENRKCFRISTQRFGFNSNSFEYFLTNF
jgi:hypothetical protein